MKWFDKWFDKKIQQTVDNRKNGNLIQAVDVDTIDSEDRIRFEVTPARGGIILSVRHYDRKSDRNSNTLHIFTDETNYAEEIGRVVAMEIYKR